MSSSSATYHHGDLRAACLRAAMQLLEESGAIEPGTKGFAQLRLESPVVALPDERFIKRKGGINECAARFTRRLGQRSSSQRASRTGRLYVIKTY